MSLCRWCGGSVPAGFTVCSTCDEFADEGPTLPLALSAEDIKLNGMDQEAADYADVFGSVEQRRKARAV